MRQSRLPQPGLFKTPHELTPSQRTTAVALLKALPMAWNMKRMYALAAA
jgi:hypothetical protein